MLRRDAGVDVSEHLLPDLGGFLLLFGGLRGLFRPLMLAFGFGDLLEVNHALCLFLSRQFEANFALGLQFAKLIQRLMESGVGSGTGAFDRAAEFFGFEGEVSEFGFGEIAAAETPGGSGDFGDQYFLKSALGVQPDEETCAEFLVGFGFVGFDVVVAGIESVGPPVFRGGFFARG